MCKAQSRFILLVLGKTIILKVLVLTVCPIELVHLTHGREGLLCFMSTLEEDHVPSPGLGDGVLVQAALWPAVSDGLAVREGILELHHELGVLASQRLGSIISFSGLKVFIVIHVDFPFLSKVAHLLHDTGHVANGGDKVLSPCLVVLEEVNEVSLRSHEESLFRGNSPLVPPQRLEVLKVIVQERRERVFGGNKRGKGVSLRFELSLNIKGRLHLHALDRCLLQTKEGQVNVLLAPACTSGIVGFYLAHHLLRDVTLGLDHGHKGQD